MIINAVGAVATGIVLVVVTMTKFVHGAWIVVAAVPVIIAFFLAVNRHYRWVGAVLRMAHRGRVDPEPNTFVLLVPDLGLATADAVSYLRVLRPERLIPLYTGHPSQLESVAERWPAFAPRMGELELLPENGGRVRSLRTYLRSIRGDTGGQFITVVIPEELTNDSVFQFLRRRSSLWVKASLLYEAGIVVTNVPLLPEERARVAAHADQPLELVQNVVLIPVSAVHAATARAVAYAKSLNATSVAGIYFVLDPEEELRVIDEWIEWGMGIPLSIVEAPFRDLTKPILDEIRRHTSRDERVVTVVLPELVVRKRWEHLLHNQTGFFLKRLLLFETNVVVTSVPFHLGGEPSPGGSEQSRPRLLSGR
jgi:hypothetical protein